MMEWDLAEVVQNGQICLTDIRTLSLYTEDFSKVGMADKKIRKDRLKR